MISYPVPVSMLRRYATDNKPYLAYDEFQNVVRHYRDEHLACQHIDGFIWDVGVKYNFWTHLIKDTRYHKHIIFTEIREPLTISFKILYSNRPSYIPLRVTISSKNILYFSQTQHLVIAKVYGKTERVTSWCKVPEINSFILDEAITH